MKKVTKIILGFFVVMMILGAIGGDGDDDNASMDTTAAPEEEISSAPEATESDDIPPTFEEQILKEICDTDADSWTDIDEVIFNNDSKILIVNVKKETSWDEEHFRNCIAYATFDIMSVAVGHQNEIEQVWIEGKTNMIDAQGNTNLEKAFQADTTMERAVGVNWEGLAMYPDLTKAIDNNFDYVFWHPAVR